MPGSRDLALRRDALLAMWFHGIFFAVRRQLRWMRGSTTPSTWPSFRSLTFARVLRRDIDAVNNAIELPLSNGQAEGQINRLKTLKRAMVEQAPNC